MCRTLARAQAYPLGPPLKPVSGQNGVQFTDALRIDTFAGQFTSSLLIKQETLRSIWRSLYPSARIRVAGLGPF